MLSNGLGMEEWNERKNHVWIIPEVPVKNDHRQRYRPDSMAEFFLQLERVDCQFQPLINVVCKTDLIQNFNLCLIENLENLEYWWKFSPRKLKISLYFQRDLGHGGF